MPKNIFFGRSGYLAIAAQSDGDVVRKKKQRSRGEDSDIRGFQVTITGGCDR